MNRKADPILWNELLRKLAFSLCLFVTLFLLLVLVERLFPALSGRFLHWSDPAFIVGIPASILGVAYVLTVRNPRNFLGFIPGILMSVLLAAQFYLQGQWDLVALYILVFVPFQLTSLIKWSGAPNDDAGSSAPVSFLTIGKFSLLHLGALALLVADYMLATYVIRHDGLGENVVLKFSAALMITSSFMANLLMIRRRNDAWINWVIFSLAGIAFFIVVSNVFSLVLYIVFLIINASAQMAWLRVTALDRFGWAAGGERIERFLSWLDNMFVRRDGHMDKVLQRREKWLLRQLDTIRKGQNELHTSGSAPTIRTGHIVDVVNRRIFDGEIEIRDGHIWQIRPTDVPNDAPYIMPGFVDAHIHIESTLLLPENYARMAVAQGTLAVIADPHEIANVLGTEGVDYMIKSGHKVRFHFHFGAPSCVPATPFETSGAVIGVKEIETLLQNPEIYGLGEMMNVPGVLNNHPDVMAKINAARACGKVVDGHAPALSGDDLQRYADAGISTDHECSLLSEARERVKKGMCVQVREGSAACDLDALAPILSETDNLVMFCSDDKYPDEIGQGYINDMCRRCVSRGLPLWNILNAACVTPVHHYNLPQGLLQKGDMADFILVDNLADFNVLETFVNGFCVYENGSVTDYLTIDESVPGTFPNHFMAQPISVDDIRVASRPGRIRVIGTTEGSLRTSLMMCEPKVENGNVVSDTSRDMLKLVCLSRHSISRPQVAFIHGFGLKRGALASTIGHDSHNIIALGVSDEDIAAAVNKVIELHGGLVVADGSDILDLGLPVAGLMSERVGEKVAKRHLQLKAMAARLGCNYRAPFMTMAFMALPVIPEIKLTDKGLFDAVNFHFTELFTND